MKSRHLRPLALCIALQATALAGDATWLGIAGNWSNPATWSGGIIADGTDATAFFTGVNISAATSITVDAPRTIGNITFTDDTTSSHDLTLANSTGNILNLDTTTGAPVINVTQSSRLLTITSVVSGADGITKAGPGRVFFNNGANTIAGPITLNAGSMQMNADGNLGDANNDLSVEGGFLIYNNAGSTIALNANRSITINADLVMNGQPTNNRGYSVAGPVSGTGKLSLTGATTDLALNGANSFTGDVAIAAGGNTRTGTTPDFTWSSNHTRLTIGNAAGNTTATLGNGSNAVILGGFENPSEGTTSTGLTATTGYTGSTGSAALRFFRDDYTFRGPISGTGVLEINPGDLDIVIGSTIELTGNNSYTGETLIRQGALKVSSSYDAGTLTGSLAPACLRFNQQGVLIIAGDLDPAKPADFTRPVGTASGEVRWTNGGGFAAAGANRKVDIGGAGASFSWTSLGTSNALFLCHPDADAKLTFLNPIDLTATAGTRNLRVFNGASAVDAEIPSTISGGAGVGIAKSDPGTLVLSGASTYDGATQINDGTLVITGTIDSSSRLDPRLFGILDLTAVSPYSIGAGRTLTGTGKVLGSFNLAGVLSPGVIAVSPTPNTPGTLTTGAIALTGSASFNIDIDSSAATSDKLVVTGAINLGSSSLTISDVAVAPATLPSPTVLKVIDYTGQQLTGTFAGLAEGATVTVGTNSFIINYAVDTDADTIADAVTLSINGDAYDTWATTKGLAAGNAAFDADPDNDGIKNGLEFVLGGQPNPANPGANSSGILPAVTQSSGNLVFAFQRKDLSEGVATLKFQWSTDLVFLPSNSIPIGAVDSTTSGITVDVTEDSPDAQTDTVVITVPAANAAAGRIFGRLETVHP